MPKRRSEGPEPSLRGLGRDLRGESSPRWTTLAGLRSLSVKAWSSGTLLRELLEPTGVYPRRRALKRPTAAELLSDYAAARSWAAELSGAGRAYGLETVEVGRNTIGSNRLPAAAVFATAEDEIAFAGKTGDAGRFRELAVGLSELDASAGPALRLWALKRPLQLLELGEAALTAARVALWLRDNPTPGIYVRQLSLPGVHTKFIEAHRRVIDEMAVLLQAAATDPQAGPADDTTDMVEDVAEVAGAALPDPTARTPAARFAVRHGFLHQPELVRFRVLAPAIAPMGGARDITVTAEAFSALQLPVHTVIATENLVNFLALPERPGTLALYGAGYGFSSLRDAAWLRKCEVLYWGDLDTHGFRILDQLRAVHPHVASVLMDEETLLAHRDAWGREPSPSTALLARLTAEEASLYKALGNDTFGSAVACLVAVMAQGPGAHEGSEKVIADAAAGNGHPAPVTSSAGALVRTLQGIGAHKVAMITPYMKPLTKMVVDYIEGSGITVLDAISLEVADNLEVGCLDPQNLPALARSLQREGADAVVLSACVQMPSLAAVQAVEDELGLPVITAATATTYEILKALGHQPAITGAGSLLYGAGVLTSAKS